MILKQRLACAVLAALPLAAMAQQSPQPLNPLAVPVSVPAPAYVSAFRDYRAAPDEQATPDKAWRFANDEVARLGGHAGHVTRDAQATSTPAQSVPAGHGKHH